MTNTPEYDTWKSIKNRCYNTSFKQYADYGGRGITVCDEWRNSFETFYRDMGPKPSNEHSIERRKNNKGYSKDNCYWATKEEQSNNRRSNRLFEIDGVTKSLTEWCISYKQNYTLVYWRINSGWRIREALFLPKFNALAIYTHGEISKTIREWAQQAALTIWGLSARLCKGWTFEEAITPIQFLQVKYDEETKSLTDWCGLMSLDLDATAVRVLRGEELSKIIEES
jgi:hypothetical protein